jgi:hypothetical protein
MRSGPSGGVGVGVRDALERPGVLEPSAGPEETGALEPSVELEAGGSPSAGQSLREPPGDRRVQEISVVAAKMRNVPGWHSSAVRAKPSEPVRE